MFRECSFKVCLELVQSSHSVILRIAYVFVFFFRIHFLLLEFSPEQIPNMTNTAFLVNKKIAQKSLTIKCSLILET